jgi:hypothetical protein
MIGLHRVLQKKCVNNGYCHTPTATFQPHGSRHALDPRNEHMWPVRSANDVSKCRRGLKICAASRGPIEGIEKSVRSVIRNCEVS